MTVDEMFDAIVAAVPDIGTLRKESIADNDGLLAHVLMADVVAWCEEHVDDRRRDVQAIAGVVAGAAEHGDEQAANVAWVSFSEGIWPGTPLYGVVPPVLRDDWSGQR